MVLIIATLIKSHVKTTFYEHKEMQSILCIYTLSSTLLRTQSNFKNLTIGSFGLFT